MKNKKYYLIIIISILVFILVFSCSSPFDEIEKNTSDNTKIKEADIQLMLLSMKPGEYKELNADDVSEEVKGKDFEGEHFIFMKPDNEKLEGREKTEEESGHIHENNSIYRASSTSGVCSTTRYNYTHNYHASSKPWYWFLKFRNSGYTNLKCSHGLKRYKWTLKTYECSLCKEWKDILYWYHTQI